MAFEVLPLSSAISMVDPATGYPSLQFQVYWQGVIESLQAEFGALEAAQAAQAAAETAQAAAVGAQTAAENAQSAAEAAQNAAGDVSSEAALASSGTIGCAIVGFDAGANAAISISAHTRAYGDGSQVSVNGGGVGALAFETLYYIYYDDPTRAGGVVTYVASEDATDAIQTGSVHSVGVVMTPADGAPDMDGSPNPAPGNVS